MIHSGANLIDGVLVEVIRKRIRCINIRVKSVWGTCHIRKRQITYNAELARVPRELVEYVVVHELTHLQAANHGPRFYELMDERLPAWKLLRRKLNKREFEPKLPPPPKSVRLVQSDFTATLFER